MSPTARSHFHGFISTPADYLVGNKIDTVDLIGMPGQVCFEFIRFKIPDLHYGVSAGRPPKDDSNSHLDGTILARTYQHS